MKLTSIASIIVWIAIILIVFVIGDILIVREDDPRIGEVWTYYWEDDNPWLNENARLIIKDIKDGWVKYSYETLPVMNHTTPMSEFKRSYNRYKGE